MTKIIKTLIIAWVILTVVAVSFCVYFGYLEVKENISQQATADILDRIRDGEIINMIDEEGNYEGGIIFIAKPAEQ